MPLITTSADDETAGMIEQSGLPIIEVPREVAHYAFEAEYNDTVE